MLKRTLLASSFIAVIALTGCDETEDKTSETDAGTPKIETEAPVEIPAEISEQAKETGWDDVYLLTFEDLPVDLPNDRTIHMDVTAYCATVIGQENYATQCREIIQGKIDHLIQVYACGGHGEEFYAHMPTNNLRVMGLFSTDKVGVSEDRLYTPEKMRKTVETVHAGRRALRDVFTVTNYDVAGPSDEEYVLGEDCTSTIDFDTIKFTAI